MTNSEIDIAQVFRSGFIYDTLSKSNINFTDSFLQEIKKNKYEYFITTHIPTFEIFNFNHDSLCELLQLFEPNKLYNFITMLAFNIMNNKYKDEIFLQIVYDLSIKHKISNNFNEYHFSKINDTTMIKSNFNKILLKTTREYINLYPLSKLFINIKIHNYNINMEFIQILIHYMYPNIYNELQLNLKSEIIYNNKFKKYIILQLIINIANFNNCYHFINTDILNNLFKIQYLIFDEINKIF